MNKQATLSVVYAAFGEDALKKRTVYERLLKRLSAYGDVDLNTSRFSAATSNINDVIAACQTAPFFSDYRLVKVDDAEKLSKADIEVLVSYLSNPNETTVLYLDFEKLTQTTALAKAIKSANQQGLIDCTLVSNKELPTLVKQMAAGYGLTLEASALNALVDLVGNDTIQLDSALKKLGLSHEGSAPVREEEIRDSVVRSAETKPWDFLDALSKRDLGTALSELAKLGSETCLSLLSMASGRLRDLVAAKSLAERGEAQRLAEVLKRQDWQVRNYVKWARSYSYAELAEALSKAADCEAAMKSGADERRALEDWLIATISK